MIFGLWGSKAKAAQVTESQQTRPSRDHRLENALRNFIKFGDGADLLKRHDELRAGSLSYLASKPISEIKLALDSLQRLGVFQDKSKTEILADLEKVFGLKELKTHYSTKTSVEIDRVRENIHAMSIDLTKPEPQSQRAGLLRPVDFSETHPVAA